MSRETSWAGIMGSKNSWIACLIRPIVVRKLFDAPPSPISPAIRLACGSEARAGLRRGGRPDHWGGRARPRAARLVHGEVLHVLGVQHVLCELRLEEPLELRLLDRQALAAPAHPRLGNHRGGAAVVVEQRELPEEVALLVGHQVARDALLDHFRRALVQQVEGVSISALGDDVGVVLVGDQLQRVS